jgi:hypothetical protein
LNQSLTRITGPAPVTRERPNDPTVKNDLTIFEGHQIRRHYDEKTETWWFSVVDIIQVLTQQADYQAARKYWKVLKGRLNKEGSQLVTNCYQLKFFRCQNRQLVTICNRLKIPTFNPISP